MGSWTPLILMAGGLAILLGTLLGISFPMGGQPNTAQAPTAGSRTSRVLPANINVNSTASGNAPATTNRSNVAQNSNTNNNDSATDSTSTENNKDTSTTTDSQTNDANQSKGPVQALW